MIVNVLKIKWNGYNKENDSSFETLWLSYENLSLSFINNNCFNNTSNSLITSKFDSLHTRGALVLKLSHSADILALASNQKYVENNCLVFMSVSNGTVFPVNLRNFGLKNQAKGRLEIKFKFQDNLKA
jgi:hypothetical protein